MRLHYRTSTTFADGAKPNQEPPAQELQRLLNLFNQKKYKQVAQIAYELLERFPTAAAVWRLLAESEQKLGHVEQSLKAKSKSRRAATSGC